VYRCTFQDSEGALKLIKKTVTAEARARREVETMRLADSPNLVKMLSNDLGSVRIASVKYLYFIEEYIDGEDLSSLLSRNWSHQAIIRLTRDLVNAVKELWNHRTVHRDIKPKNIRIRPNGEAVLLDVGIACHIDRSTLTLPLSVPGTFGYYSPEQLRRYRRNLDFRSDLFLIGICVYEVITKINPFTDGIQETPQYVERVLGGIARPIAELDPTIPSSLADLIMRLLKPYPNLRSRSFETVESLLTKAEEEITCRS
jgi:serine/threonine protein kinase